MEADGGLSAAGQITAPGGFDSAIVALETVTLGSATHAYVSHRGQDGMTLYEVSVGGTFTERARFLVTASALDDGATAYAIGADGALAVTGTLGAAEGRSA